MMGDICVYLVGCHECHVTNKNLFDTTKASGKDNMGIKKHVENDIGGHLEKEIKNKK
jgi:hypothetical protein